MRTFGAAPAALPSAGADISRAPVSSAASGDSREWGRENRDIEQLLKKDGYSERGAHDRRGCA